MDKPSSSKLPGSIEEIQEENLNEETVEGQEEMSSTERLQQKMLEMKEGCLALIKKEGKNKSSSYTPQNRPPFQDHSGSMDHLHLILEPWPHQHLTQNKDQVPYQQEQKFLPKSQLHYIKKLQEIRIQ
ncbi:hypothetical protein O181_119508 [Austropuccinia psidii MF-1]|uniref:Uncharacterized protein n=1 Tax=Austropuccinia psidii MF-1 TaxID=1389203 RepID=A0A9Q3KE07_9BASI|nr:hypothetical protein [Austropuccinia psidii MF-1]